jgi:hypothetical protein
MDRDLVVYIQVAEPNQPRLICEVNFNGSQLENIVGSLFKFNFLEITEGYYCIDAKLSSQLQVDRTEDRVDISCGPFGFYGWIRD